MAKSRLRVLMETERSHSREFDVLGLMDSLKRGWTFFVNEPVSSRQHVSPLCLQFPHLARLEPIHSTLMKPENQPTLNRFEHTYVYMTNPFLLILNAPPPITKHGR